MYFVSFYVCDVSHLTYRFVPLLAQNPGDATVYSHILSLYSSILEQKTTKNILEFNVQVKLINK